MLFLLFPQKEAFQVNNTINFLTNNGILFFSYQMINVNFLLLLLSIVEVFSLFDITSLFYLTKKIHDGKKI
jgi:hypothetical protein